MPSRPLERNGPRRLGETPFLTCAASLSTRLPSPNDSEAPSMSLLMILAHIHPRLSVPRSAQAGRQPALSWQPQLRNWLVTHILNPFPSWGKHMGQAPTCFSSGCYCLAPNAHPRPSAETLGAGGWCHPQDLLPPAWQDFTHQHPA